MTVEHKNKTKQLYMNKNWTENHNKIYNQKKKDSKSLYCFLETLKFYHFPYYSLRRCLLDTHFNRFSAKEEMKAFLKKKGIIKPRQQFPF